jgi:hypothetical protein
LVKVVLVDLLIMVLVLVIIQAVRVPIVQELRQLPIQVAVAVVARHFVQPLNMLVVLVVQGLWLLDIRVRK